MMEAHMIEPITATVKQFETISGLRSTSIYNLIRSGDIVSVTVGRRRLIVLESYRRYLSARLAATGRGEPARIDASADGSAAPTTSTLLNILDG
jgi:hypothetical protein